MLGRRLRLFVCPDTRPGSALQWRGCSPRQKKETNKKNISPTSEPSYRNATFMESVRSKAKSTVSDICATVCKTLLIPCMALAIIILIAKRTLRERSWRLILTGFSYFQLSLLAAFIKDTMIEKYFDSCFGVLRVTEKKPSYSSYPDPRFVAFARSRLCELGFKSLLAY